MKVLLVQFGDVAIDVYSYYTQLLGIVDSVIDQIEEFDSIVDKTVFDIQKAILDLSSQISRLYRVQTNLFTSYNKITTSSLPVFQRLGALNTYGNLINLHNTFLLDINKIDRSFKGEEATFIQRTYVTKVTDTYQSIATHFYGNFDRWEEIRDVNNKGDLIPGEILLIPR